ncbi:hypothetical protein HII31_02688 [Pseudocercospora fuligena]|uniref:Uncharacterized protein n=1 Tax=Pseudocercospora fuligena TaxID=685502 RepID=A0A8H6VMT7_9PEZI|nr:hypothetical protein HII31_02688 [Pseudocercospora fuligena]
MTDDNTSSSPPRSARRSSFAGETLANLFGSGHRGSMSRTTSEANTNGNGQQPVQSYPGPITQAAASAQRRRLSISTLGLSGSPNSSPFGSYNNRRDSYGTAGSDSIDESAIEDEPGPASAAPQTPFARRMSFGAKALRDVRTGGTTSPSQNGTSKPGSTTATTENNAPKAQNGTISNRDSKARGLSEMHLLLSTSSLHNHVHTSLCPELLLTYRDLTGSEGFNWSENFRTRAERTSIAGGSSGFGFGQGSSPGRHDRSKSVAVMEPPAREMPKPKEQVRPDHFQERILKGDFYMD